MYFYYVCCVESIWLLCRDNAAQILFLLSCSCSTIVIHRVGRVGTIIARNYFCIALINNQPNKSPIESFSGTVNLFFSLFNFMSIGYQNRISDRSMPQAYLCKSSRRHFPGLASIAEPNPQSMLILGIKIKGSQLLPR